MTDISSRNFLFADSTLSRPLSSSLLITESLAALLGTEEGPSIICIILATQVIRAIVERLKRRCFRESCHLGYRFELVGPNNKKTSVA